MTSMGRLLFGALVIVGVVWGGLVAAAADEFADRRNVRLWHLADIGADAEHVRFRG